MIHNEYRRSKKLVNKLNWSYFDMSEEASDEYVNAVQTVLSELEKKDKEYEELLKAYKELKEIEESHRKENGKLRERVKELEEWNEYYRKEMLSLEGQRSILREVLEKR